MNKDINLKLKKLEKRHAKKFVVFDYICSFMSRSKSMICVRKVYNKARKKYNVSINQHNYQRESTSNSINQHTSASTYAGFTLIELLVSMTIFVVVITIASGCFVTALKTQRAMVSLMAVNDNVSLEIEQMAREIRTGTTFCPGKNDTNCKLPANSSSATKLTFTNYLGQQVTYEWDSNKGKLMRNNSPLTADNVSVENLKFIVSNNEINKATRITIILKVAVPKEGPVGVRNVSTDLQTTISARNINL